MGRREYGQSCSLACALDSVGERWSLLVVRELMLGPLRFSELARAVGGAPTDVLTRRLRDLERDGIVARRELDPPNAGAAYELTELGRGLERPMLEMARWGLRVQGADDIAALDPGDLAGALRVILAPDRRSRPLTVNLRSGGASYRLRIEKGWISAARGAADAADLTLAGEPLAVIAAVVFGGDAEEAVEIEGDRAALEALREMVEIPERLREEAAAVLAVNPPRRSRSAPGSGAAAPAPTSSSRRTGASAPAPAAP
jgi:DNA-binding HxlR family transcriptional regulator